VPQTLPNIVVTSPTAQQINVPPLNINRIAAAKEEEFLRQSDVAVKVKSEERSLLDDVTVHKMSKKKEALEESKGFIPTPRKLQSQTFLPTAVALNSGLPMYTSFWNSYTYNGLGIPANRKAQAPQMRWYLTVKLADTGFGGAADRAFSNVGMIKDQAVRFWVATPSGAQGFIFLGSCGPSRRRPNTECAKELTIDCVTNYDVTDFVTDPLGGSLQVIFASEGFSSTECGVIRATYMLSSGTNPPPTPASTSAAWTRWKWSARPSRTRPATSRR
jgi:hypothetical protein